MGPAARKGEDVGAYDRVFIGFPIWYGVAPNVVNAFCEGYDWTGKTVALFHTCARTGTDKTAEKLRALVKGAAIAGAKLCRSASELTDWAKGL